MYAVELNVDVEVSAGSGYAIFCPVTLILNVPAWRVSPDTIATAVILAVNAGVNDIVGLNVAIGSTLKLNEDVKEGSAPKNWRPSTVNSGPQIGWIGTFHVPISLQVKSVPSATFKAIVAPLVIVGDKDKVKEELKEAVASSVDIT